MVYGINGQIPNNGLQEAMAGSSSMVATGLEKELKTGKVKIDFDPKTELSEVNEYVQKLTNATALERVKKYDQKREQNEKEENPLRKKPLPRKIKYRTQPLAWLKPEIKTSFNLFAWLMELERAVLKEVLSFALQPELEALLSLARELNLDLTSWKLEKINLNYKGEILLSSDLSPEERMKFLLLDEYRILYIGQQLCDSWLKLLVINLRLNKVKAALWDLGIRNLEEVNLSARRLAFLKLLALLKEAHLKRVFSSSRSEFSSYSKTIQQLTDRALKIEVNIPQRGMDLIHQKLGSLGREAARYKLELLRSLQALAPEAEREKTIHWLEHIIARLG